MAPTYLALTPSSMNASNLTRSSIGTEGSAASWYTFKPNREGDDPQHSLTPSTATTSASDLIKEAGQVASQIASQISRRSDHGLQHPSESIRVLAQGLSADQSHSLIETLKSRGWKEVPHVPFERRDAEYCYSENEYGSRVAVAVAGLIILTACGGYFAVLSTKRGAELARVKEQLHATLVAAARVATTTPNRTMPYQDVRTLADLVQQMTEDPPPSYSVSSEPTDGVNQAPDTGRRPEEVPEASERNPFVDPAADGDVSNEPGAIELRNQNAR
jgi:hypothetical protein